MSGIGKRSLYRVRLAAALAPIALLGGCNLENTQVNGKIFDLLGVSTAAQEKARAEPKMAARAGLVVPPDQNRLPVPGSGEDTTVTLNDPDKARAMAAAERERLHQQYCTGELNWKERARDPNAPPSSPYGTCTAFTSGFGRPAAKQ